MFFFILSWRNIFTKEENCLMCLVITWYGPYPLNFRYRGDFHSPGGGKWLVAAAVSLLFSCVVLEVYFGSTAAASRSFSSCIVCVYIACAS